MESSVSSLAFKGSITEAIAEAQRKKKLFIVYISDDKNSQSSHFEESIWMDLNVRETISRSCVFVHLKHGSVDALNFSALYPQKFVPSVSAITYDGGELLWQIGDATAVDLVATIERSCSNLHLQENAAAILSVALTSGSNQTAILPSSSEGIKDSDPPSISNDAATMEIPSSYDEDSITSISAVRSLNGESSEACNAIQDLGLIDAVNLSNKNICSGKINDKGMSGSPSHDASLQGVRCSKAPFEEHIENVDLDHHKIEDGANGSTSGFTSSDVHLNIRLPDEYTVKCKFRSDDTLEAVKNYLDKTQTSGYNHYDLAIPWPRRVLSDEDSYKILSELGLGSREALIVVPRRASEKTSVGELHSDTRMHDSSGYFGYLRKMFSYVNPFSYVGSSSPISATPSSVPLEQNDLFLHSENSQPFEGSRGATVSSSESRKANSRPFGSNIHTLGSDRSDIRDGNAFWNGNSTQYGSNDSSAGTVLGVHDAAALQTKLKASQKLSRLVILYFTASWCGPCRLISPHLATLSEDFPKVVFLKIDIDELHSVAAKWQVSSVPTFVFIKNGEEVDRVIGADKSQLEKKVSQYAGFG